MHIPEWFEQLFFFDSSSLNEEEYRYVRARVFDFNERMTKIGMFLAGIYLVVGMAFFPFILIPEIHTFSYICHSLFICIIVGTGLFHKFTGKPISAIAIFMHIFATTTLSYFAYTMISYSSEPDVRWLATITLVGVSGWLIVMCPSHFSGWKYVASYHVAVCVVGLSLTDISPRVFVVAFILFAAFIGAKIMLSAMVKREAMKAYLFNQFSIQSERQKFEHELNLARNIQDSMLPPRHIETKRAKIQIYRSTHEKVGGDWVAFRELEDGKIVLFVIDAVGKGIQAALVVHAVQSLWARTLSELTFNPEIWLHEVNETLLRLGEREAHSATIGMFVIAERTLTY